MGIESKSVTYKLVLRIPYDKPLRNYSNDEVLFQLEHISLNKRSAIIKTNQNNEEHIYIRRTNVPVLNRITPFSDVFRRAKNYKKRLKEATSNQRKAS